MSRLSFRPRPLDIHKKLPIVKSVRDLDNDEGPSVPRSIPQHGHNALEGECELVLAPTPKKGGGSDIPTPQFLVVDSYERDYTRTFVQPPSYIRGRPARSETAEFCEYDIDNDDEHWLSQVNNERKVLPPEKFEMMLYKLEILDHKAREKQGLTVTTLGAPMPVILYKEAAMEALKVLSQRPAVLGAVYDYWNDKRERWQKPILRRLQPPPPVNDTNPFNVFRPREKIHRPHTRRMQRRENDVQSFEKLRQVRRIFELTRQIIRVMQQREEKKREIVECEANIQRVQLRLKYVQHDAVRLDDDDGGFMPNKFIRADDGHRSLFIGGRGDHVNGSGRLISTLELTPPIHDGANLQDQSDVRRARRKRFPQARNRLRRRMKAMEPLEPSFLFTKPLDSGKLAAAGIACMDNGTKPSPFCFPGRIGRGGRLVFDRWNPLTQTPLGTPSNHFTSLSFATPVDRFRATRPPRLSVVDPLALNDTLTSALLCGPTPPSTSAVPF